MRYVTGGSRLTGSHLFSSRYDGCARERPYDAVVAGPVDGSRKPLVWCGIMEMSLAETRVSDVTRGTTTASSRRRFAGAEGSPKGARTGSGTPICICTANVSNVLLVGARRGTRKRPVAPTNSLKDKVAETRLGGFRSLSRAGGLGRKRPI